MTAPLLSPPEDDASNFDACSVCLWATNDHLDLTPVPLPEMINCVCGRKHVTHLYLCEVCHAAAAAGDLEVLTRKARVREGGRPARRRLAAYVIDKVAA